MESPIQEDPIRVCLRLRPVNKLETSRRSTNCVKVQTVSSTANNNKDKHKAPYAAAILQKGSAATVGNGIEVTSPVEGKFNFTFDHVFQEDASQSLVYQHAAAPLASDLLEGFNCALIAYGQTGSGKTYTQLGESPTTTSSTSNINKSSKKKLGTIHDNEKSGMIHRLIKDIFQQMKESPPSIEYIVRCSFVEIYLEKILDLLNPANRSIQILEEGDCALGSIMTDTTKAASSSSENNGNINNENEGGVRIDGASEACCFDESDVISLLIRGNACRTVSSTKMNTDSSRSHAIFIMNIEQRDDITGISKVSRLQLIDMAGSELGGKDQAVQVTKGTAIYQEARMINKSLSSLNAVVRALVENQDATSRSGADAAGGSSIEAPYSQSKLTRLLRDAFGGNCRTSIILTASPASYSIAESIRTMKFGHLCRNVKNFVKPSVEMSPMDYRKLLIDTQKKQVDLTDLVSELSAECFQLKQDAKSKKFVEARYSGPLWETIESVLVNGTAQVANKSIRGRKESSGDSAEVAALREELARTKSELKASKKKREHVESLLAERQSEVAILRTQNDNYASEKKRDHQDLIVAQSENRLLLQRKHEVENNLRTSQFREYEATVFLRQFRRFYRRLLKNKAAQGNGGTSEIMRDVPGIPDLKDLIDVDSLLLESGLIEESELHDDTATGTYRPSAQALNRSTEASNEAWREAARQGKVKDLEQFDQLSLGNRGRGGGNEDVSHGQLVTNRQQLLGTPAGKLTTTRERELERDLLRATERCIELQVALNEEKANVDILKSNMSNRKIAHETFQLKQQLDKKTHDLQQIIWKMNELHLINKTYNEKMSNREQHVTYLEENLVELQGSNRNMILERQEAEEKLREELDNLKVLVDAMTIPLWQFGEAGASSTLSSRIRLPVRGGIDAKAEEEDDGSSGDLESLEESIVSDDEEEEEEEESDEEDVEDTQSRHTVQIVTQKNVPMRDAAVQVCVPVSERGTSTADLVFSDTTPRSSKSDAKSSPRAIAKPNGEISRTQDNGTNTKSSSRSRDATTSSNSDHESSSMPSAITDVKILSAEDLYRGGKPPSTQPRRSVHKYGLMIRPGVLKEREKPSSK